MYHSVTYKYLNNLPAGSIELEKIYKEGIKKEAWSSLWEKTKSYKLDLDLNTSYV